MPMNDNNLSDEALMAYADGALPPDETSRINALVAADPELARRVEEHRALKAAVFGAFAPVLEDPVPQRLLPQARPAIRFGGPPAWAAMAACLVVGVLAGGGLQLWTAQQGLTGGASGLEARGALAAALDTGLASDGGGGAARVGLSFQTASGYCRTFQVSGDRPWAGLACRQDGEWVIDTAVAQGEAGPEPAYRQAASGVPQAVMARVETLIEGAPLDAAGERAAASRGWTP